MIENNNLFDMGRGKPKILLKQEVEGLLAVRRINMGLFGGNIELTIKLKSQQITPKLGG